MASSTPVWHNIFRKIVLKPDNITFEAEKYDDTVNIVRGPGVAWSGSSDPDTALATGNDTFMINVDYDISIPVASTKLSLEDVNGNVSEVNFKAGRGVAIIRNSSSELEWESYAVTETDTLQTVTERNNITNNKIFVNDIEVGTISSSFTEDGVTYPGGYDLIGNGTLDAPMQFSPLYQDSLAANNTEQFTITALGPGTLAYALNYVADANLTTGYVRLERENPASPGTWVTLDYQSGTTAGISYFVDGTYSEVYSGTVNYRLTWAWTGNTGTVTWFTNVTFEGGAYTPITNPQLRTNTTAKTVDINDIQIFQNTIRTTVSNTDIVLDPAGTGKVRVLGDIQAQNILVDGNITIGDGIGTDTLTINSQFTTGTQLKTTQSNGNTLNISAYDLNDSIYRNLITLTASNTPTLVLTSNGTGSIDNMTIGGSTAAAGTFTTLTASGAITSNTTTNNQSYTTTGAGTITISSGTTGSINNMQIGNSTAASGAFTSLSATGAITANTTTNNQSYTTSGAGTITITSGTTGSINNMTIGGSTAAAGTFTQIVRSGAVSASAWGTTGVGIRSAANIFTDTSSGAGTITNAHINVLSQPTIAASNAISAITNASTLYIANAPTNGTNVTAITNAYAIFVAAGASYFSGATTVNSNLTVSGSNAAINMSPTGASGTITMNPAGGGSLDNFNIGSTTRGSGAFTSLAANAAVTIQTTTNNQSYTTTGAGTITISSGTTGSINNMQIGNSTTASGAFTTLSASSTVSGTGFSTYLASPPAIGGTVAAAGSFTTLTGSTSILSAGTGGVGYATGAGGTGSQSTAKTDTVTINKPTGQITMAAATSLGAGIVVQFVLSNTTIAATDHVIVTHISGGTLGGYTVTAGASAGQATIYVRNNTASALAEALVLRFSVIKSVNA